MCRGQEVSRAKVILVSFFDNRADTIWKVLARERFVNFGIHPSVNSTKRKRDAKPWISVCSRIIRLMNNQTKSQKRATIPTKEEKTTTKMLWILWKLYHNWVASRKTRNRWFLKEENSPGETLCRESWDQFEEYGSLSLRHVKQVSRKRKDHRLEKYKSKILISEVPTQWKLRTRPMKRLKDSSAAREARHGTLPKTYISSKKKTKLHSTSPRKNEYSRLRQQMSLRKESLWWIPELVCIWSARETLTLPSWRPWGSRKVLRRWWRPTARCKQEKKPRYMSKNWTYSWRVMLLAETPLHKPRETRNREHK